MISTGDRRRRPPPRRRAARRRRRGHGRAPRVVLLVAAALLTVFLAAAALRGGHHISDQPLNGEQGTVLAADGRPSAEVLATTAAGVQLYLPVTQARVTAIVYHAIGGSDAVPLIPVGHQLDAGLWTKIGNLLSGTGSQNGAGYYVNSSGGGDATSSVDIGAVTGTGVYAPVSGRVVGIQPYVLNGVRHGVQVQIQPTSAPAYVVTVTNLNPVASLAVGAQVTAAATQIGHIIDMSRVMTQLMSHYTSDAGNHVHLQVGRTPASSTAL